MASGSLARVFVALIAGNALAGQGACPESARRQSKGYSHACPDESATLQVRSALGRLPRVGIVTLTRQPADFEDWARYHLDYVGVAHIFLDVENTPGWDSTWDLLTPAVRARITVWREFLEPQPANNFVTLRRRQERVMDRALLLAKDMGIVWLFHIDDDELIYSPSQAKVDEVLARVPEDVDQVRVPNLEAVYDSADGERCFRHVGKMNPKWEHFAGYANGKAAARVSANMTDWGVHFWKHADGSDARTLEYNLSYHATSRSMPPLALIHYESCLVSQWMEKFWALARITDSSMEIPFLFYRESISRMQYCQGKMASQDARGETQQTFLKDAWRDLPNDPNCTKSALQQLWAKFKTLENPRIHSDALIPITIPWDKISQ